MRVAKPDARMVLTSQLRTIACELHSLASTVETFGQLPKIEQRIKDMPEIVACMKRAASEVQDGKFADALVLLEQTSEKIAQSKLDEIALEASI